MCKTIALDLLWFLTSRLCSFNLVCRPPSGFTNISLGAGAGTWNFVNHTIASWFCGPGANQIAYFLPGHNGNIRPGSTKEVGDRVRLFRIGNGYEAASFLLFFFPVPFLLCTPLPDLFSLLFHLNQVAFRVL